MKKLNILILVLIFQFFNGMIIFSQSNHEPLYYLNSKPIDLNKVFLNAERIGSMQVTKNSLNGEVLIFTKDSLFTFNRLVDILKKYTNINGHNISILYKINGEIIEDTTSIKIDDTYFVYVKTEKLSDVKYLSSKFRNLTIVNIDLETSKRKPIIHIRGNQDILDKLNSK
jgi:hypothetical protein